MHSSANSPRRGTAMIAVATIIMTVAALAVALTDTSVARYRESAMRLRDLTLMSSAEAALNLGFSWCASNGTTLDAMALNATPMVLTLRDASGNVVTALNGMPIFADCTRLAANTFRLRVQATAGDAGGSRPRGRPEQFRRQMIEAAITRTPFTVPTNGLFAWWPYTFKGSGSATWFDSDPTNNSAAETALKTQPHIAGLGPTDTATGPVVLASGDVLTIQKPGSVTGQAGTLNIPVPTFDYSPPVAASGALTGNTTLNVGTTYRFTSWTGGTVTVNGAGTVYLYVDGDIDYGNVNVSYNNAAGKLQVRQGSATTDDFDASKINGNATLADPDHPDRFVIVSAASSNLTLNGNASIGLVLIAPRLNLKIRGNLDFKGAAMVQAMDTDPAPGQVGKVTGNPSFAYDTQLIGLTFTDLSSFATAAWRTQSLGYAAYTLNDATNYNDRYVTNAR